METLEHQNFHHHHKQASSLQILKFLQLQDFITLEAWRSCLVECLATIAFVFSSILIIVSSSQQSSSGSPMASIAILHSILVFIIILSAAPSSGGHFNPCITFLAMVLGYVSPSKLVMYTGAQCVGSIFASLCAKLVLPDDLALKFALGGCVMQNSAGSGLSIGSAFVAESMFTFVLMFVVANLALDPFQGRAFGAILPPSFIGAAVGLLIFASGGLVVGYSGAGMNPARCLGPAVVMGSSSTRDGHWVWWIAPYSATVMVSVLYCLVPPHHADLYRGREDLGSVKEAFHPPIVVSSNE